MRHCLFLFLLFCGVVSGDQCWCDELEVHSITAVPHVQSKEMHYRKETNYSLGARVQLFLYNSSNEIFSLSEDTDIQLRQKSPQDLLESGEWSWHDFPSAYNDQRLKLPPNAITVWSWNGNHAEWGIGTSAKFTVQENEKQLAKATISIDQPEIWLSSITFLSDDDSLFPNKMIFHLANDSNTTLTIDSCRLWLPKSNQTWRSLHPQKWYTNLAAFSSDRVISVGERGGAIVDTGNLPLTYSALEVRLKDPQGNLKTVWGHLRIKREAFDISGGWVRSTVKGQNTLTFEPYLKTLKRMHINTAHIADVPGYTGNPELYSRYPLKYFHKLDNFERYDSEEMLPRIHAVEFLGEPQYGGGTPVPPMKVWKELAPYQSTRLPTTVTHSEERIWRFYSGLSDYPHYDAYRITAPSADHWMRYGRWGGERIRWGAPLETIGIMTRSLRDLNRPVPIAYWSQGAHHGWGHYGGRERTSPTPNELKAQAYHALAARITSLYWFNLSLKSIVKFPDLIKPITEIGREIRMVEKYYLEGDAYHYQRISQKGAPKWDLSVIAGPNGALLFALDLDYKANLKKKIFEFGSPRRASLSFPLPPYLQPSTHAVRVHANNVEPISFQKTSNGINVQQEFGPFNILLICDNENIAAELEAKRQSLIRYEESFGFDPANNEEDIQTLRDFISD